MYQAAYAPDSEKRKAKTTNQNEEKTSAVLEKTVTAQENKEDKRSSPKDKKIKEPKVNSPKKESNDLLKEDLPLADHCFKCRQKGHFFRDCPNEGLKYFCHSCGRKNVIIKKCLTPTCKEKLEDRRRDQPT